MSLRKNFFAVLSTVRSPQNASREQDSLAPVCGEFYRKFNSDNVPTFVYTLLVSKLIHLINSKPDYQNRGRLELALDRPLQYTEKQVVAILQLIFNRDDSDSTVLFLTGHGTPKGELILCCPEGDFPLSFETVLNCWNNRTSRGRNRELLLILDFCYSGVWVATNQAPDVFIQSSCSPKEKSRDFRIGGDLIGSAFLHNLLMVNNASDCFLDGVQQTPGTGFIKPEQIDRVRSSFTMGVLFRNWDDFKALFQGKRFRLFSFDRVIDDMGEPPKRVEKAKQHIKVNYNANVQQRLEVARRLFKRFDADGSGFLDENEIPQLMSETYKSMGINNFVPTKEDVKSWLEMGDVSRDDRISLDEYEQVILNSLRKAGIKID